MPEPKARCEYRLPPDVYLEVQRRAEMIGWSRSEYVNWALRQAFKMQEADWAAFDAGVALARRRWWQRRERA